jgi:hypothetical protein
MKILNLMLGCLAAVCVVATGCGKSDKAPQAPDINGVTVDIPKFNQAFESASPEVKTTTTAVGFNIRYGKYEDALMALDKLSSDASLTEPQKKVVGELIEQVKKLAGAAPAAAPAQ